MRTQSPRLSLLLLIVALGGFGAARPSLADGPDNVSLGIAPLEYNGQYFDLTMAPGESRALKVELANHGAKKIAARTYAADAYTVIDGGFGARLDGEPVSGTTNWLSYPAQTIDLAPGMALTRSFTVTVPADAGPGEYITSLAVQNAEPTAAGSGGVAIKQVQRTVIAVAITVPGPRKPALTIGSFEHTYLSAKSIVSATVTNTGNVRLKPSGELVVSEMDGREVSRFPLAMDSVYAGDTTSIEAPFDKALLPGDYRVTLSLDHEGGMAMVAGAQFTVPKPTEAEAGGAPSTAGGTATVNQQQATQDQIDLRLVAAAGGTALALFGALIILRQRRRRSARPGPAGPDLTPRRDPAPDSPAELFQFDSNRAAVHGTPTALPTPLRHPLARAAGEQEDAPLKPRSLANGPGSGPHPREPQGAEAANVRSDSDAAPLDAGRGNPAETVRLGRLAGQKPASPAPTPDGDTREP